MGYTKKTKRKKPKTGGANKPVPDANPSLTGEIQPVIQAANKAANQAVPGLIQAVMNTSKKDILEKMLKTDDKLQKNGFDMMNDLLEKFKLIVNKMPFFSFDDYTYTYDEMTQEMKKSTTKVKTEFDQDKKDDLIMMLQFNLNELKQLKQRFTKINNTVQGYNELFEAYQKELDHCNDSINQVELYIDRVKKTIIMKYALPKKAKWWLLRFIAYSSSSSSAGPGGDGFESAFWYAVGQIVYFILISIVNSIILIPNAAIGFGIAGRLVWFEQRHDATDTINKLTSMLDEDQTDKVSKINETEPDKPFNEIKEIDRLSKYLITIRFYVTKRITWDVLILTMMPLDRTPRNTFMDPYLKIVQSIRIENKTAKNKQKSRLFGVLAKNKTKKDMRAEPAKSVEPVTKVEPAKPAKPVEPAKPRGVVL